MSEPYESVSRVEVHFSDGSCAIVKNLGMDANAAIAQLRYDVAELQAENERLRKAGDSVVAAYCAGDANVEKWKEYPVVREWLAAKGVQS